MHSDNAVQGRGKHCNHFEVDFELLQDNCLNNSRETFKSFTVGKDFVGILFGNMVYE